MKNAKDEYVSRQVYKIVHDDERTQWGPRKTTLFCGAIRQSYSLNDGGLIAY